MKNARHKNKKLSIQDGKIDGMNTVKRNDLIFYVSLMAIPVAQFLIFYVGVNAKSIIYAFQNIDLTENVTTFTLNNFKNIFTAMKTTTLYSDLTKISLISYFVSLIVGVPLGLLSLIHI